MRAAFRRLSREDWGADLVEYALLVALIAAAVIGGIYAYSRASSNTLNGAADGVNATAPASSGSGGSGGSNGSTQGGGGSGTGSGQGSQGGSGGNGGNSGGSGDGGSGQGGHGDQGGGGGSGGGTGTHGHRLGHTQGGVGGSE